MQIPRFNPSTLPSCPNILLLGVRNSGKSVMCANLLSHMSVMHVEVVKSTWFSIYRAEADFSDISHIIVNFEEEHIKQITENPAEETAVCFPHTLSLMRENEKIQQVNRLFKSHNRKIITELQYPLIPDALVAHVDYVFLFRNPSQAARIKLWQRFNRPFKSYKQFCHILDVCTQDHSALVINRTCRGPELQWYRVSLKNGCM